MIQKYPRSQTYVFVIARIHPGESNSSYVVNGLISFLLSKDPKAIQMRDSFIFKIVPMMNPDGVIAGNSRTCFYGLIY